MQRSYSIPRELTRSAGGARLRVYVALAERCNNEGTCFPSLSTIAADAGVSRRSVSYALDWLDATGWIVRTRRSEDGVSQSTLYFLPEQVRRVDSGGSAKGCTGSATDCTGGSAKGCKGGSAKGCTHNSSQGNSSQFERSAVAEATPWDAAHAVAKHRWPTDGDAKACDGFAGEVAKVAKKSGLDATRLTRVAIVAIDLQGLRNLAALTNPARSSLMARLAALATVADHPTGMRTRWHELEAMRGWPSNFGDRVQRLIDHWHTDPPAGPVPAAQSSAASRQADRVRNLAERVEASHRARPVPALPGGAA